MLKGNAKVKILVFFIFMTSFVMLAIWVANFYFKSEESIRKDVKISMCSDYDYDIIDVAYDQENLVFQLVNARLTSSTISRIEVMSGAQRENQTVSIQPGETRYVMFRNITRSDNITILIDGCNNLGRAIQI